MRGLIFVMVWTGVIALCFVYQVIFEFPLGYIAMASGIIDAIVQGNAGTWIKIDELISKVNGHPGLSKKIKVK